MTSQSPNFIKRQEKLDAILAWKANKPNADSQWAEDVKVESFDLKFDHQLEAMRVNLVEKLPKVQKDLDKLNNFPDARKFELNERAEETADFDLEGLTKQEWIDKEFDEQKLMYEWKIEKLGQSVERLENEQRMRASGFLKVLKKQGKNDKRFDPKMPENVAINSAGGRNRAPLGTQYFVDDTCGTPGNGTTATCTGGGNDSYSVLDSFTETSRSGGDIVTCRRDNTSIDNASDLLFTSDGDVTNPIIIESDYDNNWSSDVDLSGTATATLTFGSKTVTFSADVSGVVAVGDCIYEVNDAKREFAYEVAVVSTTIVTLFLPYKGDNAGSGKTMTNMQAAPIWSTTSSFNSWQFNGDNYWKVQGIHIRSTDTVGGVGLDTSRGHVFRDCIVQGNNSSSDPGIYSADDMTDIFVKKCRFFGGQGIQGSTPGSHSGEIRDCLMDANNASGADNIETGVFSNMKFIDCELKNAGSAAGDIKKSNVGNSHILLRNTLSDSSTKVDNQITNHGTVLFEDYNGTPGDTRDLGFLAIAENSPTYQSETSKVRSGGSIISIKVTPSTKLSTAWEHSRLELFEIPFYATTESKTYTVFFASDTTTEWTSNPTAAELWIELEYWGHASNNFRRIIKSTGTVDFTTDTDFDQSLTITIAPSQAGVAYLRLYYAKTKESGKTNIFYVDPIPVIT